MISGAWGGKWCGLSDGTSEPQMECKLQKSLIKVLLGPPTVLLLVTKWPCLELVNLSG